MNLTKRQKEILDFIRSYRAEHGISPTQRGSARLRFPRSAPCRSTSRLEEKARSRANGTAAVALPEGRGRGARRPLLGQVAPAARSSPSRKKSRSRFRRRCWARASTSSCVRGESMIDDGILDGDFVVARREKAEIGQTVIALVRGEATLKRYYVEGQRVRSAAGQCRDEAPDLRRAGSDHPGRRDRPDPRLRPRSPRGSARGLR